MQLKPPALVIGFACLCASITTHALTLSELDLTSLSFEIDSLASNPTVTGTSNGIAFEFSAIDPFFANASNVDGEQYYNDLDASFDDIHAGNSFTITFAEPIRALLVALANDNNTGDGPDFGVAPAETVDVAVGGNTNTQLGIADTEGALALLVFDSPTTVVMHTNFDQLDGWDLSYFAYPVPLPPSFVLFSPAIWWLVRLRRKDR